MIRFAVRSSLAWFALLAVLPGVSLRAQQPAADPARPATNGRYERTVQPGGPGPNRLALDESIAIAGAPGGFADLRFYDRDNREVPYLRVRPASPDSPEAEPLRVKLQMQRRTSEPGHSRYRIVLPAVNLPLVALEIEAADANILRAARVSEPRLSSDTRSGDRLTPFDLGSTTLHRALHDAAGGGAGSGVYAAAPIPASASASASAAAPGTSGLRVPMQVPTGTQLDLVIDDGGNAPLDVTGATAIVAPQPWIYFESADGAPLVARLGQPGLQAPSYDLEAVRQNLAGITTATAVWGDVTPQPAEPEPSAAAANVTQASLGAPALGAAIDVNRFRYARPVPAGRAGLTAVALDAAVLAHSTLADLRLVDPGGRQLPYLLESRDEPLAVALAVALAAAPAKATPQWMSTLMKGGANRTVYLLRLPHESAPVSRLVLDTSARVFTRQLAVYVEQPPLTSRDRAGARQISAGSWTHVDPDQAAPQLTLPLPAIAATELMLVVDEGDNASLPIASARLLLPGFAIRFFRVDDAPLTLYYGIDDVSSASGPRYDLALLKPYLLGVPATELTLAADERRLIAAAPVSMPSWLFWGLLAAAVLAMMALIARLLRSEPPATAA
jgi:hypothetical protein